MLICFSSISVAQEQEINNYENRYQLEISEGHFVTDNIAFLYNTHLGADLKYFIQHQNKFHHYFSTGFSFEIGTEGANLYTTNISIGSKYDLTKLWKKDLYLELNIGGLYWLEKFSTQLIESVIKSENSEFGFKAKFGLGYQFSSKITSQLNITQFSINGTSVGAGVSYSF